MKNNENQKILMWEESYIIAGELYCQCSTRKKERLQINELRIQQTDLGVKIPE